MTAHIGEFTHRVLADPLACGRWLRVCRVEARRGIPPRSMVVSRAAVTWWSALRASIGTARGAGRFDSRVAAAFAAFAAFATSPADLDGNGVVDGGDLASLLGSWGAPATPTDLDGDGFVGGGDLAVLLGAWGGCVP
ncbi:MAG: hypothetical protein RI967_1100 [Planctomycetota bacterium]|jgi:hypothetical protein